MLIATHPQSVLSVWPRAAGFAVLVAEFRSGEAALDHTACTVVAMAGIMAGLGSRPEAP